MVRNESRFSQRSNMGLYLKAHENGAEYHVKGNNLKIERQKCTHFFKAHIFAVCSRLNISIHLKMQVCAHFVFRSGKAMVLLREWGLKFVLLQLDGGGLIALLAKLRQRNKVTFWLIGNAEEPKSSPVSEWKSGSKNWHAFLGKWARRKKGSKWLWRRIA